MHNTYSAGVVTAYGAAKKAGYTGTYEEFCAEQAQFAQNAQQVREDKESVEQTVETFEETTVPAAVQAVTDAGTTQVGRVNQAGSSQVENIGAAGTTQVGNVNQAGTTQVAAVNQAGATQIQAVEDKGGEVIASIPADYTQLSEDVDDLKVGKAPVIIDSASGTIANFPDGAAGLPLKKLVAQITPVQDLHGYDSPWPEGGGANKLPFFADATQNQVTLTNDNGVISLNGTASATCRFDLALDTSIPSGSYYVRFFNDAMPGVEFIMLNSGGSGVSDIVLSSANYESAVALGGDVVKLRIYIASGTALSNKKLSPMLVIGSTAPTTFAPYSNECPISGWTGLNGQRTGENQCPNDASAFEVIESYYAVCKTHLPSGTHLYTTITDNDPSAIVPSDVGFGYIADGYTGGTLQPDTFRWVLGPNASPTNTPSDYPNVRLTGFMIYPKTAAEAFFKRYKVMAVVGDSANGFAPYSGETLSVSWQDTAGTVYGGSMTVNEDGSGDLTAKYNCASMSTLGTPSKYTSGGSDHVFGFPYPVDASGATNNDWMMSAYKIGSSLAGVINGSETAFWARRDARVLYISDSSYTDAEQFASYVAGFQLYYPLATPQIYHFDNLEQLQTILGTNNIWVDAGDVQCEYRADTKLYIDKKLAAIAAALS